MLRFAVKNTLMDNVKGRCLGLDPRVTLSYASDECYDSMVASIAKLSASRRGTHQLVMKSKNSLALHKIFVVKRENA